MPELRRRVMYQGNRREELDPIEVKPWVYEIPLPPAYVRPLVNQSGRYTFKAWTERLWKKAVDSGIVFVLISSGALCLLAWAIYAICK